MALGLTQETRPGPPAFVLELRRVEDPRQPVFAFLFVRVRDDELDQLDEILRADLTKYVRLA